MQRRARWPRVSNEACGLALPLELLVHLRDEHREASPDAMACGRYSEPPPWCRCRRAQKIKLGARVRGPGKGDAPGEHRRLLQSAPTALLTRLSLTHQLRTTTQGGDLRRKSVTVYETGSTPNDGAPCDDDLFCTTGESCQGGLCTDGVPRDCTVHDGACTLRRLR